MELEYHTPFRIGNNCSCFGCFHVDCSLCLLNWFSNHYVMVFFTSFYQFFLFVWKSILSDIRMAVPGLFFLSAWDIPFHSLVFRLCVSLLVGCFLQVASRWVIFFFIPFSQSAFLESLGHFCSGLLLTWSYHFTRNILIISFVLCAFIKIYIPWCVCV